MRQARIEPSPVHSPAPAAARPTGRHIAFALGTAIACTGLMAAYSAAAAEEKKPAPAAKPTPPAPHPGPPAGARPGEVRQGAPAGVHGNAGVQRTQAHTQVQHYAFHEHDVRHFSEHDRVMWQGGGWHHEYHNGQMGYWWFAGGSWYFYDNPVYPYPLVVSDTVYVDPDPVEVDAAPADAPVDDAAPAQPLGPPPQGYWYYCDNPAGYYPYVSSCATQFRAVPAQPPPQ